MKQSRIEKEKHKNRWLTGDRIIESSFEGVTRFLRLD